MHVRPIDDLVKDVSRNPVPGCDPGLLLRSRAAHMVYFLLAVFLIGPYCLCARFSQVTRCFFGFFVHALNAFASRCARDNGGGPGVAAVLGGGTGVTPVRFGNTGNEVCATPSFGVSGVSIDSPAARARSLLGDAPSEDVPSVVNSCSPPCTGAVLASLDATSQ